MKPSFMLKISSVVALIQFFGHGYLHVSATPKHGAAEVAVLEAMKFNQFSFNGFMQSYWDFYFGYGLLAAFNCLVEAILFWILAGFIIRNANPIKPIVALFIFANMVHAVLVWIYFKFPIPVAFDCIIIILLIITLIKKEAPRQHIRFESGLH